MTKYIPKFGIIEATLACNFNCIHCGSRAGVKRENELTLNEIENILSDLNDLGCEQVAYMGGEFFLRKDWVDILKKTNLYNIDFSIATNGYLLNEEYFEILKKLNIKGISFSLDSSDKRQHDSLRGKMGAFDKVIENIKLANEYNISTAVYTTVNKQNVSQLDSILELILDLDLDILWKVILASCHDEKFSEEYRVDEDTFIKTAEFLSKNKNIYNYNSSKIMIEESHDIGYCSDIYPNLSETFCKTGCTAGINHFGVQSNGNVKGCLSLQDDFIEGNIRETSFKEIWENKTNFYYSRHFSPSMLEGACKNCIKSKKSECKGGCRDFAHSTTGSIFNTPFCLYKIESKF